MSVYRAGGGGEIGEKLQKKREREKQRRRLGEKEKKKKKKMKLTFSAEHRKFITFIDVGFSTF